MASKEWLERRGGWYVLVCVCLFVGSQLLFPTTSNGERLVSIYVSPLRTAENSQPGVILEADPLVISRDQLEEATQSVAINVSSAPTELMGGFKTTTKKGEKYFTLEQLKNGQEFILEKELVLTPELFFSGEKMTNAQLLQVASFTYEISFSDGSAEIIVNGEKKSEHLPQTSLEGAEKASWLGYCILFSLTGIQLVKIKRRLVV